MNPFVNPKKRSITLPSGCKDLLDVLKLSDRSRENPVRLFILLVLFQAQQDEATELIIGTSTASGDIPIKYKIDGSWYDMAPFPSDIRPEVVAELVKLAKLPAGEFPTHGVLEVISMGVQLKWAINVTSANEECLLSRATV